MTPKKPAMSAKIIRSAKFINALAANAIFPRE